MDARIAGICTVLVGAVEKPKFRLISLYGAGSYSSH
jgi:hypothetical protein